MRAEPACRAPQSVPSAPHTDPDVSRTTHGASVEELLIKSQLAFVREEVVTMENRTPVNRDSRDIDEEGGPGTSSKATPIPPRSALRARRDFSAPESSPLYGNPLAQSGPNAPPSNTADHTAQLQEIQRRRESYMQKAIFIWPTIDATTSRSSLINTPQIPPMSELCLNAAADAPDSPQSRG